MLQTDKFFSLISDPLLKKYLKQILSFYVPIALELPNLRNSREYMQEEVKAVSVSGTSDVATLADKITEQRIRQEIKKLGYNWQFWGEELNNQDGELDISREYLFITDPIEGTNNFKIRNDDQWGSVAALVDNKSASPVIGIVAHPIKCKFYLGVKGSGAYVLEYNRQCELLSYEPIKQTSEFGEFTFNYSPHFESTKEKEVKKFFDLRITSTHLEKIDSNFPERVRLKIRYDENHVVDFIDLESGALEAIRNRGTIYFKTDCEMAAVFVILKEIGGVVTDGNGKPWSLGINTMIAARTLDDYKYLKGLYNRCR